MGWNDEQENTKKGMDLSTKILLAIIVCVVIIIILISILLINIQGTTTYSIYVDGQTVTTTKDALVTEIENETYVNIQEFAKLVGYEYHQGEYKSIAIENNKCYVQGANETASFYLDNNKVYKLAVNQLEDAYEVYDIENKIMNINEAMYASIDAIKIAFNVVLDERDNSFKIYTLDYLEGIYDTRVIEWGYKSILNQSFENKKAILYGYLVVNKEDGLYKVIDLENTKEIVPARFKEIEFSEYMNEFIVTNTSNQVGIIKTNGTTKIEPIYEKISVLDKVSDMYMIVQNDKYGVVRSGNDIVIYPEYDQIGLNSRSDTSSDNKYLILNTLIPVLKGDKWGAYDKQGNIVLALEYDDFGYNLNNVEINGLKKVVEPLLEIERCNGIVVKKEDKYGLFDITGKELVPIAVDSIYALSGVENEDSKYFMIYNGKELNVIDRLIIAGLIEETPNEEEEIENTITNTMENNIIINNNIY